MLIAFEGLDQSGKETQARHLRTRIEAEGRKVYAVSFPDYKTPIGQEIKLALAGERDYGPEVMQLLYIANRFEYKPRFDAWLKADAVVVCDRYRASSVAYGEAHGLDPAWLEDIQRHLPTPAMTILLDIAPETAVARKHEGRDRFERDVPLLSRVRESYRRQAAAQGWVVISGEQPKDAVMEAVGSAVLGRIVTS
jgi:dTMP kinase